MGVDELMWKTILKRFRSPDSFVSLALGLAVVLVIGMLVFNYFSGKRQAGMSAQPEEQTQETVTLPTTHVVKSGESLWTIAETYYKNGFNWVEIQKVNGLISPDYLMVGQSLTIPAVSGVGQISATTTEGKPEAKSYTVVGGDSLWDIAAKQYGTGYKWVDIAQTNHLANPDVIHAGNVFVLP